MESYRRRHSIERQRPLLHEFVEDDNFVVVVLDACRYDIFKDIYQGYLEGNLTKVWASGRWTGDYSRRTWTGNYDMTYLTTIPVVSDFYGEIRGWDYRPSNHFKNLVPLWDTDWDPSLGTVPPDSVTDTALAFVSKMESTKLVVHYSQPHVPYIGDTKILPWDEEPEGMRHLLEEDIDRPTQRIYEQIQRGEISDQKLKQAYIDNLECALEEVVRLIKRVDCPVVITGDHGEHLGEGGKYLHEEDSTLIRQVPWLIVDESEKGHQEIEPEYKNRDIQYGDQEQSSQEVKERLANLGYVE